jgi:hypothetical protein
MTSVNTKPVRTGQCDDQVNTKPVRRGPFFVGFNFILKKKLEIFVTKFCKNSTRVTKSRGEETI